MSKQAAIVFMVSVSIHNWLSVQGTNKLAAMIKTVLKIDFYFFFLMTVIVMIIIHPFSLPSNRHTASHSVTWTSELWVRLHHPVWMPIIMTSQGYDDLAVSS